MTLTHRKKRPLARDKDSLRDDRLFIVACDDTYAPKQYFDFFRIPRVQVHVITTQDGRSSAEHVLNRLLDYQHLDDDERWLLLDTDHYTQGAHLQGFISTIKEAKRRGVHVALSKPCFELWLLLHHLEETAVGALADCAETEAALRKTLGQYNKTRLDRDQYPLISVREAYKRAQRLDSTSTGGDIPAINTSKVFLLWQAISAKALPSQLPPELRGLAQER